jgi:tRNA(Ile)-lysidine synthase TilS/MesJ
VTEAQLDRGRQLGQSTIRTLLARVRPDRAQQLADALGAEVLATAETIRDDVAMLVLRVPPRDGDLPGEPARG